MIQIEFGITEDELRQRLADAVAATLRKKAARLTERREFKARRDAGLERRHARKLRGSRGTQRGRGTAESVAPQPNPGDAVSYPPECCAQTPEPPCEQHKQAQRVMRFEGPRVRTGAAQRLVGEPGKTKPAPEQETGQR